MIVILLLLAGCAPTQPTPSAMRITVSVDDKQIPLEIVAGNTVQNALQQAGITLSNLDRVEPPSYTLLANGDVVKITRVKEVFTVKENVIPFERQTVHNESLPEGKTMLVQQGVNGSEQVTYRQVLENGEETSNIVFKRETLSDPLPEIMMVGVQKPFTPISIPGRLVYLSGGNAWLMENSTGSRRPLITTGDLDGHVFSLSPKGDWLLFTRQDKASTGHASASAAKRINTLWAIDLTGENSHAVNLKVDNVINFAGWYPGKGLTILYSTVEPKETAPGWQANNDLQILSFASTGAVVSQETIIETNMGGLYGWWGTSFAFSTDGALLAYARPDEVGLVDLENKTQAPLTTLLPFQTGSSWAWVPTLGWSPDHQVLYFVTHAPKAGLESEAASPLFDLSGLPLGGRPFNATGPVIPLAPQAGMFSSPVPSPKLQDGGYRVAYLRAIFPEQSDSKRYRLAVMDRDGSNGSVIFPPEDRQGLNAQRVAWSPAPFSGENYWLAVNYQDNLWLVNSVTAEAQQITGDGLISSVDWK